LLITAKKKKKKNSNLGFSIILNFELRPKQFPYHIFVPCKTEKYIYLLEVEIEKESCIVQHDTPRVVSQINIYFLNQILFTEL